MKSTVTYVTMAYDGFCGCSFLCQTKEEQNKILYNRFIKYYIVYMVYLWQIAHRSAKFCLHSTCKSLCCPMLTVEGEDSCWPFSFCPPFMASSNKEGTRIKICIFCLQHQFLGQLAYLKLCHGIGPPAGESREFLHDSVISHVHSLCRTAF